MPAYTIAQNAGVEGAVVVGKLLEQQTLEIGYDAAKGEIIFSFDAAALNQLLDQSWKCER
jgi:chaperonin GroEL (HSP60 family)